MPENPFPKLTQLAREPGEERLRAELQAYFFSVAEANLKPRVSDFMKLEISSLERRNVS